jgi:PAS domain S-box-containing protein
MKQNPVADQDVIASVQEILQASYFRESTIFNLLPYAVYVCDADGKIINYNRKAIELWGRTPTKESKEERFSGAYKLYHLDGSYMPHQESAVAACLKDGLPREDVEVIIERPDFSRRIIRMNIVAVKDEHGKILGAIVCFYDITQQKEIQKELDWKTKELQDYVDNATIGLHWVDGNGIIIWANKAELDMLGYTKEEYIGHNISEFHVSREKINDILKRLSCNETLNSYESALRCKDGSVKTVHISSNVFWHNEEFIHTRCFTVDITEQKKLFQALKESELQHRKLIECLQTPLYTTDAEGRITLYNKAAVNLWGREPEIGKDLWCGSYKIFKTDGSELPLDSCPMAVCLKEQRPIYGEEILVARPDGSLHNVAPFPQPLFDDTGKIKGAINMLIDITEIKRTEEALRESEANYRELASSLEKKVEEKTLDLQRKNEELKRSEERYHKMIDEVQDYAIILLDKNGIVQNWNKGAEKIKGYKEEEIVGRSFKNFYLPKDRESGLPDKLLKQASEQGKAIHEGWRMRKDGSRFWGSIVLTALHDDENNLIGFSKVTRDLTERKFTEDKLREHSSQLEFQNKELEQFAYAASHDMKEPLRKIQLYNSAIADNAVNTLDEKSREYLNRSIAAAKRMAGLIEDLLKYSKTTANTDSVEQVNLNEIIDEIILMHKEELEQEKVQIEMENLPVICGIPFQIKQLMFNLINNSIKYKHPDRDVCIQIKTELVKGSEINDPAEERFRKYHKISVIDNGIGFDQQYAEKVFNIFQRLNNLPAAKGSGIGLAICKRIVQNHHGFIKASGIEKKGARFDIYLPEEL